MAVRSSRCMNSSGARFGSVHTPADDHSLTAEWKRGKGVWRELFGWSQCRSVPEKSAKPAVRASSAEAETAKRSVSSVSIGRRLSQQRSIRAGRCWMYWDSEDLLYCDRCDRSTHPTVPQSACLLADDPRARTGGVAFDVASPTSVARV